MFVSMRISANDFPGREICSEIQVKWAIFALIIEDSGKLCLCR